MRRAATSAAANTAEGGRRSGGDRLHAFRIASAEAAEAVTHARIAAAWGPRRRRGPRGGARARGPAAGRAVAAAAVAAVAAAGPPAPWPSLSLGRLLTSGAGKHLTSSRDAGLSAFDTPSLALGRLRPTGEIGSPFCFPQSPTAVGEGLRRPERWGSPFVSAISERGR
ncbi:MAG: four helix bundle protein [Kofleriaceae bacterium]|nr:four helix bundle protein [Kofleriaceae bacterium]